MKKRNRFKIIYNKERIDLETIIKDQRTFSSKILKNLIIMHNMLLSHQKHNKTNNKVNNNLTKHKTDSN